uniref:Uncharacterized protein n=1 Tax=Anguilla anguilla TaxID=7936 RepID=A0A0E9RW33_ANGAN
MKGDKHRYFIIIINTGYVFILALLIIGCLSCYWLKNEHDYAVFTLLFYRLLQSYQNPL